MPEHHTLEEVLEEALRDPETRAEWERDRHAREATVEALRSDRLVAIEQRLEGSHELGDMLEAGDLDWLLAEIWRLRAEVDRLSRALSHS